MKVINKNCYRCKNNTSYGLICQSPILDQEGGCDQYIYEAFKTESEGLVILNKDELRKFHSTVRIHGHTQTAIKGIVEGFEHLGTVNIGWHNVEMGTDILIRYKTL